MFIRRIGTAAAALALLALTPATALAKDGDKGARHDGAAKACQALRAQLGAAAFREAHGSLGRCVSQRRADEREAAADCREQREDLGEAGFAEEWAAAPTASAARRALSGKGKGKSKKRKRNRGHGGAKTDPAFARCVAATLQDIADERASAAEDEAADGEDVEEGEAVDEVDASDDGADEDDADDEDEAEGGRGPKRDRDSVEA